jgi:hypothetical protein
MPETAEPVAVAQRWEADDGVKGKEALLLRFCRELEEVVAGTPGAAIRPSQVRNRVLTSGLRDFAIRAGRQPSRVDGRVLYRDGSEGKPFPLRVLSGKTRELKKARRLRCSLISIRHMDMDLEVDGAWFRNTVLSRRRPAAETDLIATETTLEQLRRLARQHEPLDLHLFQTGLDSAVVGFYRALVLHLLAHPGSARVVPHFFDAGQGSFLPGEPWQA